MKSTLISMIVLSLAIYVVISLNIFWHLDSNIVRSAVLSSPLSPLSRFVDYSK
jgi:hypothetical protein